MRSDQKMNILRHRNVMDRLSLQEWELKLLRLCLKLSILMLLLQNCVPR